MIYIFPALVGIVLVTTLYLIYRIKIHRNDVNKAKKYFDDSESFEN